MHYLAPTGANWLAAHMTHACMGPRHGAPGAGCAVAPSHEIAAASWASSRASRSCMASGVQGKHIKTPPLNGTILPGVTRASIIELAPSLGFTVSEEPISVTEALAGDEVFTCGARPRPAPRPPQGTVDPKTLATSTEHLPRHTHLHAHAGNPAAPE